MKRLQNRIAESAYTLPVAVIVATSVWFIATGGGAGLWLQLMMCALSAYLMVELNNGNALMRVRTRMVGSTFLLLSCLPVSGFGSLSGAVVQMGVVAALLLLFSTYQNALSTGRCYYSFLCIGLVSLVFPKVLWLAPVLWLLMNTQLQSFSLRNWSASLMGLITPYWFMLLWLVYRQDATLLLAYVDDIITLEWNNPLYALQLEQWLSYAFLVILFLVGLINFWMHSYEEKIRNRQLFGFLMAMACIALVAIVLQPQYFNQLIRIAIICASPLIAHFLTLTHTRYTNIAFFVIIAICLLLIGFNTWRHLLNC